MTAELLSRYGMDMLPGPDPCALRSSNGMPVYTPPNAPAERIGTSHPHTFEVAFAAGGNVHRWAWVRRKCKSMR
jgi:hypothetical protein